MTRRLTFLAVPATAPGPARTRVLGRNRSSGAAPLMLSVMVLCALFGVLAAWAPLLIGFLLVSAAALAALALMFWVALPGAPWWLRPLLLAVVGHLLFNYGFSAASLGFGSVRVPISELALVVAIAGALNYLMRVGPGRMPLALWFFLGWIVLLLAWHLPAGVLQHGSPALRDALPTVQMLFVLPGFVAAHIVLNQSEQIRWVRRLLGTLGIAAAIYGLLYPLQQYLLAYSPRVTSLQQTIPLVGYFATWPIVPVVGICGALLWQWAESDRPSAWRTVLIVSVVSALLLSFLIVQSRGGYIVFALVILLLAVAGGQGRLVGKLLGAAAAGMLLLSLVSLSGLEIKGRVGKFGIETVVDHLSTITGEAGFDSELPGAAEGIHQRRRWAEQALRFWRTDASTVVLGIGFGRALTDFRVGGAEAKGVVVREPHNSYVSVLTRTGVVGLTIFLTFCASTAWLAVSTYRNLSARGERHVAALALGMLVYLVSCHIVGFSQPQFENPYFAAPYFFMAGAVWALSKRAGVQHHAN